MQYLQEKFYMTLNFLLIFCSLRTMQEGQKYVIHGKEIGRF